MKVAVIACNHQQAKHWIKELKINDFVIVTSLKKIRGLKDIGYKYVGEYWKIPHDDLLLIDEYVVEHNMEEII